MNNTDITKNIITKIDEINDNVIVINKLSKIITDNIKKYNAEKVRFNNLFFVKNINNVHVRNDNRRIFKKYG